MFSRVVPGAALLHGLWQLFLSCHLAIHKMHSCFETCWWLFIRNSEVECLILYLFSKMIFAVLNLLGHAVWFSNMLKCSPGKAVFLGSSLVVASLHYFQSQVASNLCETCKTWAKGAMDRILIPKLCPSKLLYSSIVSFMLATGAILMASHLPFLDHSPHQSWPTSWESQCSLISGPIKVDPYMPPAPPLTASQSHPVFPSRSI